MLWCKHSAGHCRRYQLCIAADERVAYARHPQLNARTLDGPEKEPVREGNVRASNTREERETQRTIVAVHFRIPDGEAVLVGHYGSEHQEVSAAQAVAVVASAEKPEGYEVLIQRRIERSCCSSGEAGYGLAILPGGTREAAMWLSLLPTRPGWRAQTSREVRVAALPLRVFSRRTGS